MRAAQRILPNCKSQKFLSKRHEAVSQIHIPGKRLQREEECANPSVKGCMRKRILIISSILMQFYGGQKCIRPRGGAEGEKVRQILQVGCTLQYYPRGSYGLDKRIHTDNITACNIQRAEHKSCCSFEHRPTALAFARLRHSIGCRSGHSRPPFRHVREGKAL